MHAACCGSYVSRCIAMNACVRADSQNAAARRSCGTYDTLARDRYRDADQAKPVRGQRSSPGLGGISVPRQIEYHIALSTHELFCNTLSTHEFKE